MASEMTGSAKVGRSRTTGLFFGHRVSPVSVQRRPMTATMSPAEAASIWLREAACISSRRAMRSGLPLTTFATWSPTLSVPE